MELFSGNWNLNDLAIIKFSGPDAAKFLNSQITNSVSNLNNNQAKPFAYCTAQGRILANGFIWQMANDEIGVLISKDLVEAFVKRIKMFVLRSKLNIDYMPDYQIFGHIGQENISEKIINQPSWSCIQDNYGYWVKAPSDESSPISAWYISNNLDHRPEYCSANHDDKSIWYVLRIINGWPLIRLNTSAKFLPASLNMDLNGSIDFQKGCYPGQEIIARSYYRGKVKRRLAQAQSQAIPNNVTTNELNTLLEAEDLYDSQLNKPVAKIIESVKYKDKIYLSAEVNQADELNDNLTITENGPKLSELNFISD